jgi:hypothetical protein
MIQQQKRVLLGVAMLTAAVLVAAPAQAMSDRDRFFSRYHQYPVGDAGNVSQETQNTEQSVKPADIALPSATPPEPIAAPNFARQEPIAPQKRSGLERPAALHPVNEPPKTDAPAKP